MSSAAALEEAGDPVGQVTLERHGAVAVLTVDNVEVKNGLTPEMGHQLSELCAKIDDGLSLGAAVVRGAGGTFCSGADRRRWTAGCDQAEDTTYKELGTVYKAFVRVGALQVPTVAAIRGAAVGAGLNLALSTDLRIVRGGALAGRLPPHRSAPGRRLFHDSHPHRRPGGDLGDGSVQRGDRRRAGRGDR